MNKFFWDLLFLMWFFASLLVTQTTKPVTELKVRADEQLICGKIQSQSQLRLSFGQTVTTVKFERGPSIKFSADYSITLKEGDMYSLIVKRAKNFSGVQALVQVVAGDFCEKKK